MAKKKPLTRSKSKKLPLWLQTLILGAFLGFGAHYVPQVESASNQVIASSHKTLPAQPSISFDSSLPITAKIIEHDGYVLAYDGRNKNAFWVYEKLTSDSFGDVKRDECDFKEDPAVPEVIQAKLVDYKGSGFDRGHLAPAANHTCNLREMADTFYLSNMSPQLPQLNRGYWKKIERRVRDLTKANQEIHSFTGPLYLPSTEPTGKRYIKYQVIGENDVAVPTHFFKLIFIKSYSGLSECEAYIVPNEQIDASKPIECFQTTVEKIERLSGIVFKN